MGSLPIIPSPSMSQNGMQHPPAFGSQLAEALGLRHSRTLVARVDELARVELLAHLTRGIEHA